MADLIASKNNKNKVDLKNGQVCVLVEVMKGLCCLSVLPDYFLLKKYNLAELCNEETEGKAAEGETKMKEEEAKVLVAAEAEGETKMEEGEAKVLVAEAPEADIKTNEEEEKNGE